MSDLNTKKKLKLGVIFNNNPNWMGGIIYILNLIKILDFLDDEDKPEILLFYRSELREFVDKIQYPYFKAIEWNFPSVYKGYLKSWLLHKNIFVNEILMQHNLDGLYPINDYPIKTNTIVKLVSWIADFQHIYYPEFFSKRTIFERQARIKLIVRNTNDIIVSSNAAKNDFENFFRIRNGMNIHTYNFVSIIDDFSDLCISDLREKYSIPEKYFIISNQFHQHKNHMVLLRALVSIKGMSKEIHLVMTGRFPEATHSLYMRGLHSIINANNLQSQISLIGIIPRNEQLCLMKYSQAVIQPSLFEGWSTVIEDAKSLQVPVIASNINVNIEQLGPDSKYFEPNDYKRLGEIMLNFPNRNINDIIYENYYERIRKAAKVFINIFQD